MISSSFSFSELKTDLDGLRQEEVRLDRIRIGAEFLCNELEVPQPPGTTNLEPRLLSITNRFGALRRESFEAGVLWTLVLEQTHFEDNLDLDMLARLGMVPGFSEQEIEDMKRKAAPIAAKLAELLASHAFLPPPSPHDE